MKVQCIWCAAERSPAVDQRSLPCTGVCGSLRLSYSDAPAANSGWGWYVVHQFTCNKYNWPSESNN